MEGTVNIKPLQGSPFDWLVDHIALFSYPHHQSLPAHKHNQTTIADSGEKTRKKYEYSTSKQRKQSQRHTRVLQPLFLVLPKCDPRIAASYNRPCTLRQQAWLLSKALPALRFSWFLSKILVWGWLWNRTCNGKFLGRGKTHVGQRPERAAGCSWVYGAFNSKVLRILVSDLCDILLLNDNISENIVLIWNWKQARTLEPRVEKLCRKTLYMPGMWRVRSSHRSSWRTVYALRWNSGDPP